jgi:DNA-binding IclR family transcriptional regulator
MQTHTNETTAKRRPKAEAKVHTRSKLAQLEALVRHPKGVSVDTIVKRFGWQPHTARAVLSRMGAKSAVTEAGTRVYRKK